MPWNTRAEYLRQAGASATPLADTLNDLGFSAIAPARTIIKAPHDLTPRFRDRSVGDAVLLTELMDNFYTYGRGHWSWSSGSPGAAANGGLIKGAVNYCACGIFNDSFEFLATKVLGIDGVKKGNAQDNTGKTWYNGHFVTLPEDPIDSKWKGSVMTHNYSYSALRMFKFTGHYFCNYQGVIFDATANATHTSTKTMVAFDLVALTAADAAAYNGSKEFSTYEVRNVSEHFVSKPPDLDLRIGRWILVPLGLDTLVADGLNRAFGRWLLTQQSKVSLSEIENFTLISGRTSKKA